jgi:hypothetical protein
MKKIFVMAAVVLMAAMSVQAQKQPTGMRVEVAEAETDSGELSDFRVIQEIDTVWHFAYEGLELSQRDMHRIDIGYQSKDLAGDDVELSGMVCIPADVYSGEQPCDGIILYNHYTTMSKADAPTAGYATGIDYVMANPLNPNYIVVCSDFLGFGLTADRQQAFCFNDINGQASIDCLLAARRMLDERGISYGRFTFNAGYSSGGFDAIATQRVRDMKYADQVVFDKTLVGGAPFDIVKAYNEMIKWKDDPVDPTFMPLFAGMLNYNAGLGFTNEQMFREPLASKFDEWYMSGRYSNDAIRDSVKGMTIADLVQPAFLDWDSEEYQTLRAAAAANSMKNDWTPDSTQSYYVMHLMRDSVVPTPAGRAFIEFLNGYRYDSQRCEGYKKTIVPERTRLQTNFFIPSAKHTMVGGIFFYLNMAAVFSAYPVLYYDGELNTYYADMVEPATLMGIVHLLESKGIDVRALVKSLTNKGEGGEGGEGGGGGGLDFFSTLAKIEETLNKYGTSTGEMLQMLSDSGVEITDLLQLFAYLNSSEDSSEARVLGGASVRKASEDCIIGYYERRLNNWLRENNVNIYE